MKTNELTGAALDWAVEQIDKPVWWHVSTTPTYGYGPTPLIAAMRCYVASKLGDEVEVPVELLGD